MTPPSALEVEFEAESLAFCRALHKPARRCWRCRNERVLLRIHDDPPVYVETVGTAQYLAVKRLLRSRSTGENPQ